MRTQSNKTQDTPTRNWGDENNAQRRNRAERSQGEKKTSRTFRRVMRHLTPQQLMEAF